MIFQHYQEADLTAVKTVGPTTTPSWPTSAGAYSLFPGNGDNGLGYPVPQNQVLRIKHIITMAYARTGVGSDLQGMQAIPSNLVLGQFLFQPVVTGGVGKWYLNGNQPGHAQYATTNNATNEDIKRFGGIYGVVDNPLAALNICMAGNGPGLDIVVPGGNTFNVLFSIIPAGRGTGSNGIQLPIQQRFYVGGPPDEDSGGQRVDFAAVYILGDLS